MSLIKFRKGKFAHFIASPLAFVTSCITIFKQPVGWGGILFLKRMTTDSEEVVEIVMENVALINFTAYLESLRTGKITK